MYILFKYYILSILYSLSYSKMIFKSQVKDCSSISFTFLLFVTSIASHSACSGGSWEVCVFHRKPQDLESYGGLHSDNKSGGGLLNPDHQLTRATLSQSPTPIEAEALPSTKHIRTSFCVVL